MNDSELILWWVEDSHGCELFADRDAAVKSLEERGIVPPETDKHIGVEKFDVRRCDPGFMKLWAKQGAFYLDGRNSIRLDDEARKLVAEFANRAS